MNRFTKAIAAIMLIVATIIVAGCNKPDEPNNEGGNNDSDVRVTTYSPQEITATTAKCGGDVIVTQGLSLSELGVCWSKEQNPTADQDHLSTTIWNEPFVCTIYGLESDTKYYVRTYALRGLEYYYGDEKNFTTRSSSGGGTYNGHDYVDLGLPSGTLWATCNVGAESPEEYGDYYAWGETQLKETYDWSTYQYCMGSPTTLTKYCSNSYDGYNGFIDDLTTLLPEDDAATANWGNGWSMPTIDQWRELLEYTTHIWITFKGVNGFLFTANDGNNNLFFPASGDVLGDSINGIDRFGIYLSCSRYTDYQHSSWDFCLHSEDYYLGNFRRCYGASVRPVHLLE